jgi:hypothetical protein
MASIPTPAISEHTTPQIVWPTCPLCHTVETTVTDELLQAGGYWTCATCDHVWSARRLETVAAYALYVAAH